MKKIKYYFQYGSSFLKTPANSPLYYIHEQSLYCFTPFPYPHKMVWERYQVLFVSAPKTQERKNYGYHIY